ncbi:ribosome-associated translation inhibitor RaiA [Dehalobacterium formicoaceticum]|uniref:Ribosome hibernation promoting factor n=1 Tax=Dehalobacterium formicoaceticum TaxID=51515 RepID=A0ABT1Y3D3_9FIRM|nr:ribosome-associated translation inhibitor RaiA [Dehalobacterium formicoaceticum]MCR6545389.1 ribosome-associated translation inhibitor RaiA [Dehalobacterium formicoaceticum]
MKIILKGRNTEVTPALRDYAEKRLGKLSKYIEGLGEVYVTLLVEKDRHRVEVTIPLNGLILRGEEETSDMYSSIDLVEEKLEKQIEKYKTRINKKTKTKTIREMAIAYEYEQDEPRVVRNKKFPLKPMPMEEAILQMNLLGHNFFVFSNGETEEVNVIYRRKDGNYGLIEPEV